MAQKPQKNYINPNDLSEIQETYIYPSDIRQLEEENYINKDNEKISIIKHVERRFLGLLDTDLTGAKKDVLKLTQLNSQPELKSKDGLTPEYVYGDINSFEQRMLRQRMCQYFCENGDIKDHSNIMSDTITVPFPITEGGDNPYFLKQENALASKRVNKNKNKYYRLDINIGKLIFLHHPMFSEEDKLAADIKELNEKYNDCVKFGIIQFLKEKIQWLDRLLERTEEQAETTKITNMKEQTINLLNEQIRITQQYANDIYSKWKNLKAWRNANTKSSSNDIDLKIQKAADSEPNRIESFILGQLKMPADEKNEIISKKQKELKEQLLTIEIKIDGQVVSRTTPKQLSTSFEINIQQMFSLYVLTMPNEITLTIYVNKSSIATSNITIPGSQSHTITSANYNIEWVYFENKKKGFNKSLPEEELKKLLKDYEYNLYKGKIIVKAEWEREGNRMPPLKIKYSKLQEPSEASTEARDDDQTELMNSREDMDANDPGNKDKLEKLRNIQLENYSVQIQESALLPLSNLISYRHMLLKAKRDLAEYRDLSIPLLEQEINNSAKLMEIIKLLHKKEEKENEQQKSENQEDKANKRKQALINKINIMKAYYKQGKSIKKLTTNSVVKEFLMAVTFSCADCMKAMFEPRRRLRPRKTKRKGVLIHLKKECVIKVHIMKGHNLPIRDDVAKGEDQLRKYEESIKNVNQPGENRPLNERFALPPNFNRIQSYVEVVLVKKGEEPIVKKTEVLEGIYPEWNQLLEFTFKARGEYFTEDDLKDDSSMLYFTIFDYRIKLTDRDDSTAILAVERRYIGSFYIPLMTIFENSPKLEAMIEFDKPFLLLGYHTNMDQVMEERRKVLLKSQSNTTVVESIPSYISLSCYFEPLLKLPSENEEFLNNRDESFERMELLEYGFKWLKEKRALFKDRDFVLFGCTIDCVNILLCRYIKEIQPPLDVLDPSQAQNAIEKVARYVSLIPFVPDNTMFKYMPDIWCTSQEFLDLGGGDYEEHAILLCNYFNYIDHTIKKTPNISSFIAIGKGVPEGKTTYVIRREKRDGHILVEIWNPVTAKLYYIEQEPFVSKFLCFTTNRGFKNVNNVSDTICLLKSIGTVVSSDNIYINIQPSSDPTLMSYDFENPLFWTSFVNSDVTNKYLKEKPLTNAPVINDQIKEEDPFVGVNELEGAMEAYIVRQFEEIRNRKEGLRRAMRTKWARKVKNSLKNSLAEAIIQLEEYKQKVRNGSQYSKLQTDKFTEINNMQIRETLYQSLDEGVDMFGFPINTCVSNKEHIWQMIKNTSKFLIRYVSISR